LKESVALLNDGNRYKKVLTTIIKADKPFNSEKEKQKSLRSYKNGGQEN
jgi:hypothetical protein